MHTIRFISLLAVCLLFTTCREDDPPPTQTDTALTPANDYFPAVASYQWTFNSNTFSDSGKTYANFDMKIDTATFRNGVFLALKVRLTGDPKWYGIIGLKDSGNIVYSLTDNPPVTTPIPVFKHTYADNEGVRESVILNGVTYSAVKITFDMGSGKTYAMWFAKGSGLIKDSSSSGASLFSDNNQTKNVLIKSSLVTLLK